MKSSENKAKDVECVTKEFGIQDRFLALNHLMPTVGNFLTLILAKGIQEKLEFTQAEIKKFEIIKKTVSGNENSFGWKIQKKGVKITFSSAEFELLKTKVSELDKTSKITPELLSLCLMIREG